MSNNAWKVAVLVAVASGMTACGGAPVSTQNEKANNTVTTADVQADANLTVSSDLRARVLLTATNLTAADLAAHRIQLGQGAAFGSTPLPIKVDRVMDAYVPAPTGSNGQPTVISNASVFYVVVQHSATTPVQSISGPFAPAQSVPTNSVTPSQRTLLLESSLDAAQQPDMASAALWPSNDDQLVAFAGTVVAGQTVVQLLTDAVTASQQADAGPLTALWTQPVQQVMQKADALLGH